MWTGNLQQLKNAPLSNEAKRAIADFIQNNDMQTLPCGRYELGEGNFVNILQLDTKESDGVFEAHKKYADIFFVISGAEYVSLGKDCVTVTREYKESDDYYLCTVKDCKQILLTENAFCAFTAGELHKSGIAVEHGSPVKKAVFKIKGK